MTGKSSMIHKSSSNSKKEVGGTYLYEVFHYVCVLTVVAGLDDLLAQHIAHLFIRDPISLFAEKLEQNVETETDHFEVR